MTNVEKHPDGNAHQHHQQNPTNAMLVYVAAMHSPTERCVMKNTRSTSSVQR